MSDAKTPREQWYTLLDDLVDELCDMSDEEFFRLYPEEREDVPQARAMIQGLVGDNKTSPLEAIRQTLSQKKNRPAPSVPQTPEERRSLFAKILTGNHTWADNATLAFRELDHPENLSDEEIERILEDLSRLHDK